MNLKKHVFVFALMACSLGTVGRAEAEVPATQPVYPMDKWPIGPWPDRRPVGRLFTSQLLDQWAAILEANGKPSFAQYLQRLLPGWVARAQKYNVQGVIWWDVSQEDSVHSMYNGLQYVGDPMMLDPDLLTAADVKQIAEAFTSRKIKFGFCIRGGYIIRRATGRWARVLSYNPGLDCLERMKDAESLVGVGNGIYYIDSNYDPATNISYPPGTYFQTFSVKGLKIFEHIESDSMDYLGSFSAYTYNNLGHPPVATVPGMPAPGGFFCFAAPNYSPALKADLPGYVAAIKGGQVPFVNIWWNDPTDAFLMKAVGEVYGK